MYKLISIQEDMMTRNVLIQNLETNTRDLCFDDSALKSDGNNFEFMKIGELYDCKIKLFGDFVETPEERVKEISILNEKAIVGNTEFLEVRVDKDVYYILKNKIKDNKDEKKRLFKISRKDLIQVNDIIHDDLR